MPGSATHQLEPFLAQLRERHAQRLPADQRYEAMMYQARLAPTTTSLQKLVEYVAAERPDRDTSSRPVVPTDPDTLERIGSILSTMQWPHPEPLGQAAALLPGWDTLHISALLHSAIPDYAIFGPREAKALASLGFDVHYQSDPDQATTAYGAYLAAIRNIREAAGFDQVPESHHYLSRIIQTALEERARE